MAVPAPQVPLNLLGIPIGLTGLAGLWTAAAANPPTTHVIGDVLWIIAVVAWIVTFARYLRGAAVADRRRRDRSDGARGRRIHPLRSHRTAASSLSPVETHARCAARN